MFIDYTKKILIALSLLFCCVDAMSASDLQQSARAKRRAERQAENARNRGVAHGRNTSKRNTSYNVNNKEGTSKRTTRGSSERNREIINKKEKQVAELDWQINQEQSRYTKAKVSHSEVKRAIQNNAKLNKLQAQKKALIKEIEQLKHK